MKGRYDMIAEELLGELMLDNTIIDELPKDFSPEYFEDELHRTIFEQIRRLRSLGLEVNPKTISEALRDSEACRKIDIEKYTWSLVDTTISLKLAKRCADILRNCYFDKREFDKMKQENENGKRN